MEFIKRMSLEVDELKRQQTRELASTTKSAKNRVSSSITFSEAKLKSRPNHPNLGRELSPTKSMTRVQSSQVHR